MVWLKLIVPNISQGKYGDQCCVRLPSHPRFIAVQYLSCVTGRICTASYLYIFEVIAEVAIQVPKFTQMNSEQLCVSSTPNHRSFANDVCRGSTMAETVDRENPQREACLGLSFERRVNDIKGSENKQVVYDAMYN